MILETRNAAPAVSEGAETTPSTKSKRGFAAMDEEVRRQIARAGGRAAHAQGKAHHFDADEAREAGRKGGASVSRDRAHMAEIGRAGGLARSRKRRDEPAA